MTGRVLVGIDVGGSGLRLAVERDGESGSTLSAPGMMIAANGLNLRSLVRSARDLLRRNGLGEIGPDGVSDIDVLVWGSRSIASLADPSEVLAAVSTLGAADTLLTIDAVSGLAGALGEVTAGAAVAAGTGAVAVGGDFLGPWRRADGWGHVLGDRGSAAWIGLRSMRCVARMIDLGQSDPLVAAALEHYGPITSWPRQVMGRPDQADIAGQFAPIVSRLADEGSPAAIEICTEAGTELAATLLAAAGPEASGMRLSWTGQVFTADWVRRSFLDALAAAGCRAQEPVGTPLDGALVLARHLAAGGRIGQDAAYLWRAS